MENLLVRLLPRRKFHVLIRYGASTLIVSIAAVLRYTLGAALDLVPVLLFIPAVFLCALLFNKGSGFFATILSALVAAYFFVVGRAEVTFLPRELLAIIIFVLVGFILAAVTEMLRETVSRLEQAERTKAILLEELAHRTKNDLSIISSAITLQAQATANPDVRHALETANARVLVIASAQERLRGDIDGGRLDLAGYLEELCRDLGNMLRDVRPIAVRVKCEPMDVANSVAVHVGLIVNELVTNAFKYAYPDDRSGTVNVEIKAQENGLAITVTDDGVGCPADVPSGLGTRLVRLLVQQRGGTFRREPANPGCRAQVMLADMV